MAAKRRKTNRDLLEGIESKISRIDQVNSRVDNVYTEIIKLRDNVTVQINDFRSFVDTQFNNHLSVHTTQRKWYIRSVLGLTGLIIVAVGFNNVSAIIKIVTAVWRWL